MIMVEDANKQRGLDSGYSWVVMAATFGACFVSGGILQTTGIMFMALLEKYEESITYTERIFELFTSLNLLASPLGSLLIDRTSCRVTVVVGALMMAIGCIITAFSPNIDVCRVAFGGLAGTGAGIVHTVLFVVNGFNFRKWLNLAQGISLSGWGVGLFVLAPVMEAIKATYGYTSFFLFVSGLCLQLVVMGTLMRPSILEMELKQKRLGKTFEMYANLLKNKCIWCLSISMFMYFGAIKCMFIYWRYLCISNGVSYMQVSVVLSLTSVAAIIGHVLTGVVASLPVVKEYMVLVGSFAILAVSLILSPFYAASFVGHVVIAIIVGLCCEACFVVLSAINVNCIGLRNLSAAIGLEFVIGGIAVCFVFPFFTGILDGVGWSSEHIFVICGACLALAALFGLAPRVFKNHVTEDYSTCQDIVMPVVEMIPLANGNHINSDAVNIEPEEQPFILNLPT